MRSNIGAYPQQQGPLRRTSAPSLYLLLSLVLPAPLLADAGLSAASAEIATAAAMRSFLFERAYHSGGEAKIGYVFCVEDSESRSYEVIRLRDSDGAIEHAIHLEGRNGVINWSSSENTAYTSKVVESSAVSGWDVPTFDLQYSGVAALEGITALEVSRWKPACSPDDAREFLESQFCASGGALIRYENFAYRTIGTCGELSGALVALVGIDSDDNGLRYTFPIGESAERQEIVDRQFEGGRIVSSQVHAQGKLLQKAQYSYSSLHPVIPTSTTILSYDNAGMEDHRVTVQLLRVGEDYPLAPRWDADGWRPAGSALHRKGPEGSWQVIEKGTGQACPLDEVPSLMDACMQGARADIYQRLAAGRPSSQ